ncbi:U7 snRNA-associated Sm-like protein LSm10 [Platysternon megacephalum]|uniref:U7 snRNA-associated Sm-like protein LSm10 n=1 Tax=Platysternon megacephalum TaxID=55544 RepID=A0A4D9F297_9SAUR|nr:U7 snRNA-associated Sm-like protein LSm10 [Platysternon megacephalum]
MYLLSENEPCILTTAQPLLPTRWTIGEMLCFPMWSLERVLWESCLAPSFRARAQMQTPGEIWWNYSHTNRKWSRIGYTNNPAPLCVFSVCQLDQSWDKATSPEVNLMWLVQF